jgi:peptide/nickel transport system ATP-binding protein
MQDGETYSKTGTKWKMGIMSQVQQLESDSEDTRVGKKPLLKISHLAVEFSRTTGIFNRKKHLVKAVDDVSFEVYESEIISLVGESGSGKTTIARCILGLTKPNSGSITFDGKEVVDLKGKSLRDYRRHVQLIFQDPFESLNPRMDVFSIVATPIRRLTTENLSSEELVRTVSRLLSETALDPAEVLHKYPHELSGGQRQRVNIARALASNPKLLVADEPVTMLDASQRMNILSILMQLKVKRNLTILLITHDLASAKIMSDRTMVMYLGKLVEEGPTVEVLSRPFHPYSDLILAATPRVTESIQKFDQSLRTIEESEEIRAGCVFVPRCKYSTQVCKEVEPKLTEKSQHHLAACHNPLNMTNQKKEQFMNGRVHSQKILTNESGI